MSTMELLTKTTGIRNPNYFNGRVLTADTLRGGQEADRQHRRQIGQALGEGVVYGFEVALSLNSTAQRPALDVTSGLAFNRNGDAIALPEDLTIELVPQTQIQSSDAGLFVDCAPPPPPTELINFGFHILTARPTSEFKESAPMVGLNGAGVASGCGKRYAVEGLKFFLTQMPLSAGVNEIGLRADVVRLGALIDQQTLSLLQATGTAAIQLRAQIAANLSKLRNGAAHLCFGTDRVADFPVNPFARAAGKSTFTGYGAIDELRAQSKLTNCDMPLALLYWTKDGVQFVDMWPARRELVPRLANTLWPLPTSHRRLIEGEAAFFQFQQQVEDMFRSNLAQSALSAVAAENYFFFLPAAGIIPLTGIKGSRGFDYLKFFEHLTTRNPVFMEGAKLEHLIRASLAYTPIEVKSKELVWLYLVSQNMQSIAENISSQAQPYLVFTNGHLPFHGEARYDLSRFDYSNYV